MPSLFVSITISSHLNKRFLSFFVSTYQLFNNDFAFVRKLRRENNRKCADSNFLFIDQILYEKIGSSLKSKSDLVVPSVRTKFPKSDILL